MNDMIKIEEDMKPKLIGETWRKYPTETSKQKATYGLFECQYCKKEFECQVSNVKRRHTKSCGCQIINNFGTTHGLKSNRFYGTWRQMKSRCFNPRNVNYIHYGARGITVCEEWLDIKKFIEWAELTHPNIEGVTLDRIDNNKGYSPDNCRWANKTLQGVNQRIKKNNTSGFVGASWHKGNNKWVAQIRVNKIVIHLGYFNSVQEAVEARDIYIIQNNLPHKLSTDYIKGNFK